MVKLLTRDSPDMKAMAKWHHKTKLLRELKVLEDKRNRLMAELRFTVEFDTALASKGIDPEDVIAMIDGENIPGSAEVTHWPAASVINIRRYRPYDIVGVWVKPRGRQIYFDKPIINYPRYDLQHDYDRSYDSKPKDPSGNIEPPEMWHEMGDY